MRYMSQKSYLDDMKVVYIYSEKIGIKIVAYQK